ncbi:hypothetical protein C1646_771560 [Rhizophagus diaphanus]|nr:hypothetical protein C1646_771560 [Rhizophagus diaphanus] [Rhizophagus sp. MUCL 43196]
MSEKKEITPFLYGVHSQIADEMSEIFFNTVCNTLKTFVTDSFLQAMFLKSSDNAVNKATFLTTTFGEDANPKNYLEQSKATNIQPMTLSALADSDPNLEDSDDSAKDDDTDIIIESTLITLTSNPVPIS